MAKQIDLINEIEAMVQDTSFTQTELLNYMNRGQREIAGGILLIYPDRTQIVSSPLPLLSANDTLTTSTSLPYIDMPSNFGREILALISSTSEQRIDPFMRSFAELLDYYPALGNTNRVTDAVVVGDLLYYQGMPSTAESLIAYYYRLPFNMATITGASDISFATNTVTDGGSGFGIFNVGQIVDVSGTSNNDTSLTITAVATTGATMAVSEDLTTEANTSAVIKSRPDGIPIHLHETLLTNYAAWKIQQRQNKTSMAPLYKDYFMEAMFQLESYIETVGEPVQLLSEPTYRGHSWR